MTGISMSRQRRSIGWMLNVTMTWDDGKRDDVSLWAFTRKGIRRREHSTVVWFWSQVYRERAERRDTR